MGKATTSIPGALNLEPAKVNPEQSATAKRPASLSCVSVVKGVHFRRAVSRHNVPDTKGGHHCACSGDINVPPRVGGSHSEGQRSVAACLPNKLRTEPNTRQPKYFPAAHEHRHTIGARTAIPTHRPRSRTNMLRGFWCWTHNPRWISQLQSAAADHRENLLPPESPCVLS